ncbi:hypothetical protein ACFXCZ_02640 [Streptomyces sp. NPDC059396]|uniref:hypothetical protein n=1 Tax=Streptomyces sp. NPDC059396 TaxID=3346819 RepID=UPI0036861DD1
MALPTLASTLVCALVCALASVLAPVLASAFPDIVAVEIHNRRSRVSCGEPAA